MDGKSPLDSSTATASGSIHNDRELTRTTTLLPSTSPDSALTPPLMTAQQVGDLLNGVPASTVHAWARSGYLPSVKIGRHRRFVRRDVLGFIERRRSML